MDVRETIKKNKTKKQDDWKAKERYLKYSVVFTGWNNTDECQHCELFMRAELSRNIFESSLEAIKIRLDQRTQRWL